MIDYFAAIQDRDEIWRALRQIKANRIAEIGVSHGHNISKLIRCKPELAVAIDVWRTTPYYKFWNDQVFEGFYQKVCRLAIENRCLLPIRLDSIIAANLFPNNYFDFIYIDAQHDYLSVKANIKSWWPKVKHGGFLSGHDYYQGEWTFIENVHKSRVTIDVGTKQAVDEFAAKIKRHVVVYATNAKMPSWIIAND